MHLYTKKRKFNQYRYDEYTENGKTKNDATTNDETTNEITVTLLTDTTIEPVYQINNYTFSPPKCFLIKREPQLKREVMMIVNTYIIPFFYVNFKFSAR